MRAGVILPKHQLCTISAWLGGSGWHRQAFYHRPMNTLGLVIIIPQYMPRLYHEEDSHFPFQAPFSNDQCDASTQPPSSFPSSSNRSPLPFPKRNLLLPNLLPASHYLRTHNAPG
jgi:hypothetical protein